MTRASKKGLKEQMYSRLLMLKVTENSKDMKIMATRTFEG